MDRLDHEGELAPAPSPQMAHVAQSAPALVGNILIIYLRYSCDSQRQESCADQERLIRQGLARKGIDATHAIVIRDEAISGEVYDRAGFQQLMALALRPHTRVTVAVDDQGRLSRDCNVYNFIVDLKFNGGRFLSIGENIDSNEDGWELLVKVMEIHHSHANREKARQCRRGLEGRVLDQDGSAGDYVFGYRSVHVDPEAAFNHTGHGPRPPKRVVINEDEAVTVRLVFNWFAHEGLSLSEIARRLTKRNIPKGHRAGRKKRTRWSHLAVRRMLENRKYIGIWTWGSTQTIRNSRGRKKQVAAKPGMQHTLDRPSMRILDQEIFDKAQVRLELIKSKWGPRPGQRPRGARVHYTSLYPSGVLNGLIVCGYCGRRLHTCISAAKKQLRCPDCCTGPSRCGLRVFVERAETRLLAMVLELFSAWPEWIATAWATAIELVRKTQAEVPGAVAAQEKQLTEAERKIANLVEQLADGRFDSPAVRVRLAELETQASGLRGFILEQRKLPPGPLELPSEQWVRDRLQQLGPMLAELTPRAALLLRKLLGPVRAYVVCPQGKRRGYSQLRFRINGWSAIIAALDGQVPPALLAYLPPEGGPHTQSPELVIDLGAPTRLDKLAPQIDQMRRDEVSWNRIAKILGVGPGNAWTAWDRWKRGQKDGAEAT